MKDKKLPHDCEDKEFAKKVAVDYTESSNDSNQIGYIWFDESGLQKLIRHCRGYEE